LRFGESILKEHGITDAINDAWWLMEMVFKIDRSEYLMKMDEPVGSDKMVEYESTLNKRAEHVPLQYIVGETEFMGLKFSVNTNVLIPRQDTETLVEEALKVLTPGMKVLDLCTGSGCVIISILHNLKGLFGYATDISKQALLVAKENARANDVNVSFERSDIYESVVGIYDVIVSNPPYIRSGEIAHLMPEVRMFEPQTALDGGEDGLIFYRRIIGESRGHLSSDGYMFLEIGYDQGGEVSEMMRDAGFCDVTVTKDLAGNDRVVSGRLPYDI
jgi:release factor glutamine methyltransferase